MDQNTSRSSDLPQPLRFVASGLRHLPGAEQVGRVADSALDAIGAVSPRGRRMAVYTGAGVLGVAGVVEWPVALTGAAVAWLTQPRPEDKESSERSESSGSSGSSESSGSSDGAPAAADGRRGSSTRAGQEPGAASGPPADQGPSDRLSSSHHRYQPAEHPVHEQPAKVGDSATASALKQVAEATTHHGQPTVEHPQPTVQHPGPTGAHGRPHDDRHDRHTG